MSEIVFHCESCGVANPVWFAPNAIWNLVVGGPEAKGDPGGMLCPCCFIACADTTQGFEYAVWKLSPETDEDKEQSARIHELLEENRSMRDEIERLEREGRRLLTTLFALRIQLEEAQECEGLANAALSSLRAEVLSLTIVSDPHEIGERLAALHARLSRAQSEVSE